VPVGRIPRTSQVLYLDQNYLSGFAKHKPHLERLAGG
jgi:hypothetical protein